MENDSGGNAQVVLCLIVAAGNFREVGQHVVKLYRANRKSIAHVPIDSGAQRRGERSVGIRRGEHARTGARAAEEDLAKRRKPAVSAIGEARAKHVRK